MNIRNQKEETGIRVDTIQLWAEEFESRGKKKESIKTDSKLSGVNKLIEDEIPYHKINLGAHFGAPYSTLPF